MYLKKIFTKIVICMLLVTLVSGCSSKENRSVDNGLLSDNAENCVDNYNCYEVKSKIQFPGYAKSQPLVVDDGMILMNRDIEKLKQMTFKEVFSQDYIESYSKLNSETGELIELDMDKITGMSNFNKIFYYDRNSRNYLAVEQGNKIISVYDNEWNEINKISLDFLEENESFEMDCFDNKHIYLMSRLFNEDETCEFAHYIIDYDGNVNYKYEEDYGIVQNEYTGCLFANYEENAIYYYDEEKGFSPKQGYELYFDDNFESICCGDDEYDMYGLYTVDNNKYLVGLNADGYKTIINFSEYNDVARVFENESMFIDYMGINADAGFTLYVSDEYSDDVTVITMCPSEQKHVCDINTDIKEVVIYSERDFERIKRAANDFNDESDEYKVVFKTLDEVTGDDKKQKLYMDILKSGEVDGIILTDRDDAFVSSGAFLDLNEYFEYSDTVKKEDFLDNVIDAVTLDTGEIYCLCPSFTLSGFASKGEDYISDYCSYGDWVDSGKAIALGSYSPIQAICTLIRYSGDGIVDKENTTVDYDKLRSLIEMIKKQSDKGLLVDDGDISDFDMFINDYIKFDYSEGYNYSALLYNIAVCGGNLNTSIMGMNNFALDTYGEQISIASTSENKEGMYAFLDYLFSDYAYNKYYCERVMYEYFPVLKTSYDDIAYHLNQNGEYVDRFGRNRSFNGIPVPGESSYLTEFDREKTFNCFMEIVDSSEYVEYIGDTITNMIHEETEPYFDNKQDIDKTMSNIEEKMNNILRDY